MDGITDIITEGITTDITITTTTIGTEPGLSASVGVQGITAIGKRIFYAPRFTHSLKTGARTPAIERKLPF